MGKKTYNEIKIEGTAPIWRCQVSRIGSKKAVDGKRALYGLTLPSTKAKQLFESIINQLEEGGDQVKLTVNLEKTPCRFKEGENELTGFITAAIVEISEEGVTGYKKKKDVVKSKTESLRNRFKQEQQQQEEDDDLPF